MFIYAAQTGCRRFNLYKTFLLFVPEFSNAFSAPEEFPWCTRKYFSTGWSRTFDLQIINQMLYQWATASFLIFLVVGLSGVYAFALVQSVVGTHAFAGVSLFVFGPTVTGVHGFALLHDVACTHAVAGVCSRNSTFYIPQCRKILVPGARPELPPGARLLWHGGM
jgi:hypothetical protein